MTSILTLNTRSSTVLDVAKEYFSLSAGQMRRDINLLHAETVEALKIKNIEYSDLRSALVPQTDKHEAAYLFDTTAISSNFYGLTVFNAVMPLLDRRTTQSVRAGDLTGPDQEFIGDLLADSVNLARNFTFRHSSEIYCIYVNNLSATRMLLIDEGLRSNSFYIGYVPTITRPLARTYFSVVSLVTFFLKRGSTVILPHEDDRSNTEDFQLSPYPFHEHEYRFRSIQSTHFELFLTYKIERSFLHVDEGEEEMTFTSISDEYASLNECDVLIEPNKIKYLQENKSGSMKRAGLHDISLRDVESEIKRRIKSNYVYNLKFMKDHGVATFNVIVEGEEVNDGFPQRVVASFEYVPTDKTIRLITLY